MHCDWFRYDLQFLADLSRPTLYCYYYATGDFVDCSWENCHWILATNSDLQYGTKEMKINSMTIKSIKIQTMDPTMELNIYLEEKINTWTRAIWLQASY